MVALNLSVPLIQTPLQQAAVFSSWPSYFRSLCARSSASLLFPGKGDYRFPFSDLNKLRRSLVVNSTTNYQSKCRIYSATMSLIRPERL